MEGEKNIAGGQEEFCPLHHQEARHHRTGQDRRRILKHPGLNIVKQLYFNTIF